MHFGTLEFVTSQDSDLRFFRKAKVQVPAVWFDGETPSHGCVDLHEGHVGPPFWLRFQVAVGPWLGQLVSAVDPYTLVAHACFFYLENYAEIPCIGLRRPLERKVVELFFYNRR